LIQSAERQYNYYRTVSRQQNIIIILWYDVKFTVFFFENYSLILSIYSVVKYFSKCIQILFKFTSRRLVPPLGVPFTQFFHVIFYLCSTYHLIIRLLLIYITNGQEFWEKKKKKTFLIAYIFGEYFSVERKSNTFM